MDYTHFKVVKCPPSVYYIPSFLSESEEESILTHIDNTPKPKWTQLSNRRLINYGGLPHKNGMIAEGLPNWLKTKVAAVNSIGVFDDAKKANHVLVNEYMPGQGILPHSDGPLFHPIICTISCQSHTILRFHGTDSYESETKTSVTVPAAVDEKRREICQLLLEPRSLLILKDDMYKTYLHSIDEKTDDIITSELANLDQCIGLKNRVGDIVTRNRRISLTIRHVPKTSKIHLRLGH